LDEWTGTLIVVDKSGIRVNLLREARQTQAGCQTQYRRLIGKITCLMRVFMVAPMAVLPKASLALSVVSK
jgi:hypothetical protein